MSLRARLRISIVALVTAVVLGLSAGYLHQFTSLCFQAVNMRADLVLKHVKGYLLERADQFKGSTLADSKQRWTDLIRTDPALLKMLEREVADDEIVLNILITDSQGTVLAASSPHLIGRPYPDRTLELKELLNRSPYWNLWELHHGHADYSRTLPLTAIGSDDGQAPLFNIRVIVDDKLLREALAPAYLNLAIGFLAVMIVAPVLAFFLPGLVLNPLERLSHRIDMIRTGDFEIPPPAARNETREFAAVQSKLNLLSQQYRGAREDAQSLRGNVEELLQRLDEAVLLFDASGHLMMAGPTAERLLGRSKEDMAGKNVEDLFPWDTLLGATILDALASARPLRDRRVAVDGNGGGVVMVNMEVLRKVDQNIGTLITLRDAESRQQIQTQLDVSTRLAAIGRLTGGVAHEIKNPLNAMALHLEVLRSKLEPNDPEIDVISKEIKRLDHVVKTFLNFNRPIELRTEPVDLNVLAAEVIELVGVDARQKQVTVESKLYQPQWINADPDLVKQAILNIVVNAVEAMQEGGRLQITSSAEEGESLLLISDNGPGIPQSIQDKIFDLYFSTKKTGSGIGLAMTFRVVQLHGGNIQFSSKVGSGTEFRLGFPTLRLESRTATPGAR